MGLVNILRESYQHANVKLKYFKRELKYEKLLMNATYKKVLSS